jgi:hypothetical protein
MRFPALAFSERYDGDGRRLAFQIRPSAKQVMREALKRDAAQRRAATTRARLIEEAETVRRGLALMARPPRRGRAVAQFPRSYNYCRTSSSDEAW